MTSSVTFPTPIVTADSLDQHVLNFLASNPQGVRNSDVGRAIGYNDSRQWFSYGVLERLIRSGKVRKDDNSRYFLV
jgi:DNA-binding IclR family transcriptional regulator